MRLKQRITVCVALLAAAGSSPPLHTNLSQFYQPYSMVA
jgi:hypothetical protein